MGGAELYNLAQDPMEQQDLSDQLPEQLAIMMNEFKGVERGESIHAPLLSVPLGYGFFWWRRRSGALVGGRALKIWQDQADYPKQA